MEIKTEADDVDEGVSPNDYRTNGSLPQSASNSRWTSPRINKKLKHALSFSKSA